MDSGFATPLRRMAFMMIRFLRRMTVSPITGMLEVSVIIHPGSEKVGTQCQNEPEADDAHQQE